jgi:hypothetical protein
MEGEKMKDKAMILAMIIVLMNTMLLMNGYITEEDAPAISSILGRIPTTDPTSEDYQTGLVLKDETDEQIQLGLVETFFVGILDFIQALPFVGAIVFIFNLLAELLINSTFGIVILLGKMGTPTTITIPLGVAFSLIFYVALYEHILNFIAQRGGSR